MQLESGVCGEKSKHRYKVRTRENCGKGSYRELGKSQGTQREVRRSVQGARQINRDQVELGLRKAHWQNTVKLSMSIF